MYYSPGIARADNGKHGSCVFPMFLPQNLTVHRRKKSKMLARIFFLLTPTPFFFFSQLIHLNLFSPYLSPPLDFASPTFYNHLLLVLFSITYRNA
ncbi:hypothetical protein F4811DRAFT_537303 [Daldinia bambusicola]|nr:hypothetical protein F4811DRAFT_537303 [Daldinia bambusicola]